MAALSDPLMSATLVLLGLVFAFSGRAPSKASSNRRSIFFAHAGRHVSIAASYASISDQVICCPAMPASLVARSSLKSCQMWLRPVGNGGSLLSGFPSATASAKAIRSSERPSRNLRECRRTHPPGLAASVHRGSKTGRPLFRSQREQATRRQSRQPRPWGCLTSL